MMKSAAYRLCRGLAGAMARLPFPVLYALADVVFVLMYHVVRYRRTVVASNLRESFPEKTPQELRRISRRFYRNFADYIFETVKLLHISPEEIRRRITFAGTEALDALVDEGRSVACYFSHTGNWEWASSFPLHSRHRDCAFLQIYRPLDNKAVDRLMLDIRGRFGAVSLAKSMALRHLIEYRRRGIVTVTGFMSDQRPSHNDPAVVRMFLNHPTAFIGGTEALARRLGMAAVYWDTYKTGRGRYRIDCRVITPDVASTPRGEVTAKYAAMLEETIKRNPAIWLWTHKRWKKPVELPST